MSLSIIKYPNPVLTTRIERNVISFDALLHSWLDEMVILMEQAKGIGLSANQVGITLRFFLMKDAKGKLWEFINPVVLDHDGGVQINEGCLSFPGIYVQVPRFDTLTVKAQDRNGEEFTVVCQGIEAVCAAHEIDHLDGLTFLDKTSRNQRRAALKQLGLK